SHDREARDPSASVLRSRGARGCPDQRLEARWKSSSLGRTIAPSRSPTVRRGAIVMGDVASPARGKHQLARLSLGHERELAGSRKALDLALLARPGATPH